MSDTATTLGELIDQELQRYAEAGEELHGPALHTRLIAALREGEARHPQPSPADWSRLPARYIPGTPLHWRYGTAAGE
jgi:hypothetical protein